MYRIIKPRGAGKTTEILRLAHETNATVVCAYPELLKQRARELGYKDGSIRYMRYSEFLNTRGHKENFLIDEIDGLLHSCNNHVIGYSLSEDD